MAAALAPFKIAEAINKDYSVGVRHVSSFWAWLNVPIRPFFCTSFAILTSWLSTHAIKRRILNGNTSADFACVFFFIFHFPWIFEIAVNIELTQWNMGRSTKLRTKSGRKHLELSLHQMKGLQQETHDNVIEAPYSLRLVVMVFVHLIMWPFKKSWIFFSYSCRQKKIICQCLLNQYELSVFWSDTTH